MAEKLANNAATTLAASILTPSDTTCTVADASAFPPTGNFRIKIEGEILIVTGVSSSTFTITRGAEGTVAATHASGAAVVHVLTKGGLEGRTAGRLICDAYANKPAAGVKGRLFLPTDGLFLEYDDGANWQKYGPYNRLKPPPQTGWLWYNQGNATATFTPGGVLVLEDPDLDATATTDVRLYVRPVPALPATITMAFVINGVTTAAPWFGFCARSSGGGEDGQFTTLGLGPNMGSPAQLWQKQERYYASPTATESGGQVARHISHPQRFYWWRFSIVGSRKYNYFSADGVNWVLQSYANLYDGSTPNQVGIFIDPQNNGQKVSLSLVHWEES